MIGEMIRKTQGREVEKNFENPDYQLIWKDSRR
jgi:hypothetical protein